jgi:hypothetical protein
VQSETLRQRVAALQLAAMADRHERREIAARTAMPGDVASALRAEGVASTLRADPPAADPPAQRRRSILDLPATDPLARRPRLSDSGADRLPGPDILDEPETIPQEKTA